MLVYVHLSPSALPFYLKPQKLSLLFSFQAGVRGQQVEQSPSALRLQEGTSPTLRCNFSTTMNRVQWFQQNPGGGLISLFYLTSGTKQEGRLKATVNFQERYSTLHISTSQMEDSGTYLCAAGHSAPRGPATCPQTAAAATVSASGRLSQKPLHSCGCPDSGCSTVTSANRIFLSTIIPHGLNPFPPKSPFQEKFVIRIHKSHR
uniref:Ig-like domain-containing protein n=1 Tax=Spermophilus dauricus TaxID=99837 RepID=A0A8C9NXP8_SPEDA